MHINEYNLQLFDVRHKKISEVLAKAQKSTYYRNLKIVTPKSYQDFLNIPLTSFDYIQSNEDFTTGGSTGTPTYILK